MKYGARGTLSGRREKNGTSAHIALDERVGLSFTSSSTSLCVFPCMTPKSPLFLLTSVSTAVPLDHDPQSQVNLSEHVYTDLLKVIAKLMRKSAIAMPLKAPGALLSRFSMRRECFLRTRLANGMLLPCTRGRRQNWQGPSEEVRRSGKTKDVYCSFSPAFSLSTHSK